MPRALPMIAALAASYSPVPTPRGATILAEAEARLERLRLPMEG